MKQDKHKWLKMAVDSISVRCFKWVADGWLLLLKIRHSSEAKIRIGNT